MRKMFFIVLCLALFVTFNVVSASAKSCQLEACEEKWPNNRKFQAYCLDQQIKAIESYEEKYKVYFDSMREKAEKRKGKEEIEFSFEEKLIIDCMIQAKTEDCKDATMLEPCIEDHFNRARELGLMK